MVAYAGALQPKKKSELQEIAQALAIHDTGSKEELLARIKKHLDVNADTLEDDPVFAGLFGRRRRSVQPPQNAAAPVPLPAALAGRFAPSVPEASSPGPVADTTTEKPRSRRSVALEPIKEHSSTKDAVHSETPSAASTPAKKVVSALHAATETALAALPIPLPLPPTPSSLVGQPQDRHQAPAAPESPMKKLIDAVANSRAVAVGEEAKDAVVKRLKETQQTQMQGGAELLVALRGFLSNSRNIWSLTSVVELLYILGVTVPWQFAVIPLGNAPASPSLTVPFPPLSALRAPALWAVLLHWALPTVLLPALFGSLVSFDPALRRAGVSSTSTAPPSPDEGAVVATRPSGSSALNTSTTPTTTTAPTADLAPLDPLTAAIARLFLASAYPYTAISVYTGIAGLDVLGGEWRVRGAALGLACAFAEAVGRAPGVALGMASTKESGGDKNEGVRRVEGRRVLRVQGRQHRESPEVD